MNLVMLAGYLARDPELRHTPQGTPVGTLRLALRRPATREDGPDADFVDVTVWGQQAEACAHHLAKGRFVVVSGHLRPRTWERQDGTRGFSLDVVADRVEWGPRNGNKAEYADAPADEEEAPEEVEEVVEEKPAATRRVVARTR